MISGDGALTDHDGGADRTVGELVGRCLRAVGATRVIGASSDGITGIPGLGHVRLDEPELASLVADAVGRLGVGPGVSLLPGRRLRLASAPGVVVEPVTVSDPADLPEAVATWSVGTVHGAVELVLDLDLEAPPPPGASPLVVDPASGPGLALGPELRDVGLVVLAGPGVVRDGAVDHLRAFATRAGCGIVNTWGAKGVLAWDDPAHFGTVGLQERDFDLAGVTTAPIVVAVGLDPAESPPSHWARGQVLEVEPWQLATLAMRWPEPDPPPPAERPELYRHLAAALGPRYESDEVPLAPARAARDLSYAASRGALVAADPGPAGLWVARAFPTTEPGAVVVPATGGRGSALALALAAGLDGRASFAVATEPFDTTTEALLEVAVAWHTPAVLVAWGADVTLPAADAHLAALRAARREGGPQVVGVPIAFDETRILVDVAGPVVAWSADGR